MRLRGRGGTAPADFLVHCTRRVLAYWAWARQDAGRTPCPRGQVPSAGWVRHASGLTGPRHGPIWLGPKRHCSYGLGRSGVADGWGDIQWQGRAAAAWARTGLKFEGRGQGQGNCNFALIGLSTDVSPALPADGYGTAKTHSDAELTPAPYAGRFWLGRRNRVWWRSQETFIKRIRHR